MGHAGVGWVHIVVRVGHVGWGGSCRVGRSYRGGVGHIGVGWVMQGWGGS